MWMVCGIVSIALCILGWVLAVRKRPLALWASVGSLAFLSLTLLMEHYLVRNWVNRQDLSALLDVVPTASKMLTVYVLVMLLANIGAIGVSQKTK